MKHKTYRIGLLSLTFLLGSAISSFAPTSLPTGWAMGSAIAERLAKETGAQVVQVIGRTATLYRENPELERKHGAPPPWRER